jgi:hypothetical protein
MNAFCLPITVALLVSTAPAFAAVTVTSPANGAAVTSPLPLTATTTPCSGQTVGAMGFSFDNGITTILAGGAIAAQIIAPAGVHILHVKSWGNQGSVCVTDVTINVAGAAPAASPATTPVTNIVVSTPANGATISSPFSLSASGTQCSSQTIGAFGFSLDSSPNTTFFYGSTMATSVTAAGGAHILHVKSWGNRGAACTTDVAINVVTSAPALSGPVIPANAIAVNAIQNLPTWKAGFDVGTGAGASSGIMNLMASPALSGSARQFITTYSNYGGERYYTNFGADTAATNFVFDARVYLASPINDIANIEMDMNQVMANGQTVIFGFQCDGWSHSWDYTANVGTPTSPNDQWIHSNQTCNPQAWAPNTWHHVQVSYSRDNSGNVTYKSVWLDGVEQDINVTAGSAFALGWGSSLVTNLQVDGMTGLPGTATMYLDNLTIYRW